MLKLVKILLILIGSLLAERQSWSDTSIESFINANFNKMIFREPVYLIPYEAKIGFISYGGPSYIEDIFTGQFTITQNPIILDYKDTNNSFVLTNQNRLGYFIELDLMKYNISELLYHQNLVDISVGGGGRYTSFFNNPIAPIYFESSDSRSNQGFRFRPILIDIFINTSVVLQYSPKFYFYSSYSFGFSGAYIFESLAQQRYLNGTGFSENISFGYKHIFEKNTLPYNYSVGLEVRLGRTKINNIYDDDDVTPIIGIDMQNIGLFLTFASLFGGTPSAADQAYSLMLEGDYINASNRFNQFLKTYNYDFRYDEAKQMLNFCYSQIPYQEFDIGISLFNKGKLIESLAWFNRAEQIADEGLLLEISSYKRDIAMDIINKTKKNLNANSFSKSISNLNRARSIAPSLWTKTDEIEATILIRKGDIMTKLGSYFYAVDYYKESLELNPNNFDDINEKYTQLVILMINDMNKTKDFSEINLVVDYLKEIISLKPRHQDKLQNIINQIDERLQNYQHAIAIADLKKYVKDRRSSQNKTVNEDITLGMTIHEVELILGYPKSIEFDEKNGMNYQLWLYDTKEKLSQYFFENAILLSIN